MSSGAWQPGRRLASQTSPRSTLRVMVSPQVRLKVVTVVLWLGTTGRDTPTGMPPLLHSFIFLRKDSVAGTSIFAVVIHTDESMEEVFEGTRRAVVAWCAGLAPELEQPVSRCLDLLAVLPPHLVQHMSLAVPPQVRSMLSAGDLSCAPAQHAW